MFVVMKNSCTPHHLDEVLGLLPDMQAIGRVSSTNPRCIIEILSAGPHLDRTRLEAHTAVDQLVDDPTQLLATLHNPDHATRAVPLNRSATVGDRRLAIIAGPCSVEDESRLLETAHAVAAAGAVGIRGGAFKPRAAPYSFQGLGEPGLYMLARAREHTGLAIVTEVLSSEQVTMVAGVADVLQVGSRNMHHPPLLRALGRQPKPVLLKRGWSATLDELLLAAEYIRQAGNPHVILCERGIRTFEKYVRNTLALAVIPETKRLSNLPIIVDPSHGTGRAHLVAPMCRAAIACGADGLLIEVHPDPPRAWSDGDQSLDFAAFRTLMKDLKSLATACNRDL